VRVIVCVVMCVCVCVFSDACMSGDARVSCDLGVRRCACGDARVCGDACVW